VQNHFITENGNRVPVPAVEVFSTDEGVRHAWYVLLSQVHAQVLRDALKITIEFINESGEMSDTIVDELWTTFGDVLLTNVCIISRQRLRLRHRGQENRNLLPMDNLIGELTIRPDGTLSNITPQTYFPKERENNHG